MIDRRRWSAGMLGAALAAGRSDAADRQPPPPPAPGLKVLRYAFEIAETSFDPVKVDDLYSRFLTGHIYEGLYHYDHLARPVKIKPLTADGMPEVSADFRTWTVRVRPGIYFPDDPAFKGVRRELVAQDYVYVWKRIADPANRSPLWTSIEADHMLGLGEARQQALDGKRPFDFERELEGVRTLDRYTLQFRLRDPRPRYLETLAAGDLLGAVPREAVEFYGDQFEAHPIGTGPFRLAQWRRSSFIVLERNPQFREMLYDAEPAADDVEGRALAARFKGRRLPMVDRVEISIIEEEQPRWLSFVNGEADLAYRVGYQFASQAMPNGKVAPNLAKRGIHGYPILEAAANFWFFNMEDPVVGGYTPDRIALRRAISLAMDVPKIISYAYSGLGSPSQGPPLPSTSSFDPHFKSEFGDFDPARSKALLDVYGYRRGADGWRVQPDGSTLVLQVATTQNQRDRKIAEVLTANMKAIGLQMQSLSAQWPENLKAARAGKLQMWGLGLSAAAPDGLGTYQRMISSDIGGQNYARFRMPAVDALYERLNLLPDGPERVAGFRTLDRLAIAYMPYKFAYNRVSIDMTQPQLVGYRRPVFWLDWWQYVDIDESLRQPR